MLLQTYMSFAELIGDTKNIPAVKIQSWYKYFTIQYQKLSQNEEGYKDYDDYFLRMKHANQIPLLKTHYLRCITSKTLPSLAQCICDNNGSTNFEDDEKQNLIKYRTCDDKKIQKDKLFERINEESVKQNINVIIHPTDEKIIKDIMEKVLLEFQSYKARFCNEVDALYNSFQKSLRKNYKLFSEKQRDNIKYKAELDAQHDMLEKEIASLKAEKAEFELMKNKKS